MKQFKRGVDPINLTPEIQSLAKEAQFPLSKEKHKILVKRIMESLYSLRFVTKNITIYKANGDSSNTLETKTEYIFGANTPIMREVDARYPSQEGKAITAYTLNDKGEKVGAMSVTTGEKYKYLDNVVMVTFKMKGKRSDDLLNQIKLEGIAINEKGGVKVGGVFKPFIWSVSNTRTCQMLLSNIDQIKLMNIVETVNGGVFDKIGEVSYEQLLKATARFGLFQTPAIEILGVGNDDYGVLVVDGKFKSEEDYTQNADIPDELRDSNVYDGGDFRRASYIVDVIFKLTGIRFSCEEAACFNTQQRVNKMSSKTFAMTVVDSTMDQIIKGIKEGGYSHRFIGNENNIVLVVDSDGAKTLGALEDCMRAFLLDVAKGSYSELSSQVATKIVAHAPETTYDFVKDGAEDKIINFLNGLGEEIKSTSLACAVESPWKVLLRMAQEDKVLMMKIINDKDLLARVLKEGNTLAKSIVKTFKIAMEGLFQRAFFDASQLIADVKVLKTNNKGYLEAYSPDVLWDLREEIAAIENNPNLSVSEQDAELKKHLTTFLVKYPTPGDTEYVPVLYRTYKQVLREINSKGLDPIKAIAVRDFFKYAGYGTTILAASNTIKRILAGMDTDYDGIVAIFDKTLNSIIQGALAKEKSEAIDNGEVVDEFGGIVPIIRF